MLRFFLLDNPLTPDPKDCRAQVLTAGNRTMDDIIDIAMKRGSLVTRPDLKAVLELVFEVMTDEVAEGYSLSTPLCHVRQSIRGVFENDDAVFDPSKHEVRPSITAGALLEKKMRDVIPVKDTATKAVPILRKLYDQVSGSNEGEITPGSMAILKGSRLRWDALEADQGLFFIDSAHAETKVDAVLEASPSKISFQIPAGLATGNYTLQLRSRSYSTLMRTGILDNLEVK